MNLPPFNYHPDPVASGSFEPSDATCICCERPRGFIYVGPVYAVGEYEDSFCPWCIADGSAHEKFDATFTDEDGIGMEDDEVDDAVRDEISQRTPGFGGWQQEQWLTHCGDGAQFIGKAGHRELLELGAEAILAVQDSTGLANGPQWEDFFNALDKHQGPTAYLFRCRTCQALTAYQDNH